MTGSRGFVIPLRLVSRPEKQRETSRQPMGVRSSRVSRIELRARVATVLASLVGLVFALGVSSSASAAWGQRFVTHARSSEASVPRPAPTASLSLGAAGLELDAPPPPEQPTQPLRTRQTEVDIESTLQSKRSVPPFWIKREYDTHVTRAVAFPPLFIHRTPKPGHPEKLLHADLALTFGWYSKSTGRRRWFNPVGLFFGGFSERKTQWGAIPLLMGYRRVGEQFNFGQFPLVWWWGTKFVKNFLVVPFHYQQKRPDGFQAVSSLLFWYGHSNLDDTDLQNDRRHFVAAPLFWRFQRGLRQFDFAFLYFGGYDKLEGRDYRAVLPFAVWGSSEFGNRKELWTLPWVQREDRARATSAWAVPLALTFRTKTRDKELFTATPLFWRTKNHLKGSTFTLAGVAGIYDDPDQRNNFVAPFWYQFKDKQADASTSILLPLGFARRTPERRAVWTLLGGGARGEKGWAMGVTPALTFAGRSESGRSWQGVLGAFWHVRNPNWGDGKGRDTGVMGPLAFWSKKGDMLHVGLPPLLVFGGGDGSKHYQVFTPLIWHVRDPAKQRRTFVLAPFYHHKYDLGFEGGLAPVAFWGNTRERRYGIVPPLLFAHVANPDETRALTLSPLFVRSNGPDHRTLGIGLLGWDVERPNERHTTVFPFMYRRRKDDSVLLATLLGGTYRTPETSTSVYTLAYHRRTPKWRGFGFAPILYHHEKQVPGGIQRNTTVFPVFTRTRSPQYDLDMWSPLVWRSSVRGERPRRNLAVIPFYFRQRQPDGIDVDAGLPWFWSRDERRRTHTLIVGPGFHRLSRTALNAGIAPIYWWHDSAKKRRLLALPAIFHFENKDNDEHTTVALPFWFDRQRANGARTWAAFPFVIGTKRLYNFTRFSLTPPLYFDVFRINRNVRFTGFVPLLFRYQKCGFRDDDEPGCQYTLWGSAPFFLYGRNGQGRRTHAAALLYYWDRSPDGWKLYTPLFGVNNQPGKELGWYAAGPLLAIKTTRTHRRVMSFPLYYRRAHRLEDESLTLVAPPLFISQHREDRRWFEAGLLVWQFRKQHKITTTVLPPIFFMSDAYAQRRLYWLAPLFLRDNQIANDKTWTAIAPALYVQHRDGEDLDFVQFPLVWHIERGANEGTFGAFVWWDIRVKDKTFQTVPALYTRWATSLKDTKVIGPGLGWWTRGRGPNAGEFAWRALFGAFGAGREDGRRYISIFGAKIDRGPANASAQTRRRLRALDRQARRASRRLDRKEARLERAQRRLERLEARTGRSPSRVRRWRLERAAARVQRAQAAVQKTEVRLGELRDEASLHGEEARAGLP